MPGEKKIKITIDLSETARLVNKQGLAQTKTKLYGREQKKKTSVSLVTDWFVPVF